MKTIATIFISIFSLVTVNAKDITSTIEITAASVIPAAAFTAENTVVVNWSATNEMNNSRYEMERSFYSNNFTTIATLQIAVVNGTINNYRINDNAAELAGRAVAYYRVKQIAADGKVSYSNMTTVILHQANTAAVKTNNTIQFAAAQNGNAVISIKTITGQTAATVNTTVEKGNNSIALTSLSNLPKGMYVTEVSVNGVVINNQKVIAE
jgi:hypothetical protein